MSILRRLGERFWFVPALLCVLASAGALGLVALDRYTADGFAPGWTELLLYRVGSDGSRDLLGAIATSSLAVAGTTFSITMAVLALTSSSYGPRLVRNFMADKGNQIVLGVYVATFLYCLLVLRAIRVLGDPGDGAEVFVPHLAVNGAVLLAVGNVAVLIYFIHHISDSVQVATLAGGVRADLLATVDRLYPDDVGAAAEPGTPLPELTGAGDPLTADRAGYLQSVTQQQLLRTARRHDVVVRLLVRPGDYVLPETVVARIHPEGATDDALARSLRRALQVTDSRTPYQDVAFAVQQLTEMAVRALSPGTNDPYTARNAVDDLSAGLAVLASRPAPSPWRRDGDGDVRVHAPAAEVPELVGQALDQLRWYAAGAPSVVHACVTLVGRVGTAARRERSPGADGLLRELDRHLDLLTDAFAAADHHPHDVAVLQTHVDRTRAQLLP